MGKRESPLAEGRELKSRQLLRPDSRLFWSPLAEGRELKYKRRTRYARRARRPSRRGVN